MSTKTTKLVELTQKELTQVAGGHDPHHHHHHHSGYDDPAYHDYLHYYYDEYLPYYYGYYSQYNH